MFGSVQDDILLPNKYPYRSTQISSVCKLGCGILFVLGLFIDQISLLVPGKIHSRFRFLPACSWFSVLPWPHTLPCLGFSATPQPHLLTRLHSLLSTTLAMAVPPSCPDYTPSGLPISLKNWSKPEFGPFAQNDPNNTRNFAFWPEKLKFSVTLAEKVPIWPEFDPNFNLRLCEEKNIIHKQHFILL